MLTLSYNNITLNALKVLWMYCVKCQCMSEDQTGAGAVLYPLGHKVQPNSQLILLFPHIISSSRYSNRGRWQESSAIEDGDAFVKSRHRVRYGDFSTFSLGEDENSLTWRPSGAIFHESTVSLHDNPWLNSINTSSGCHKFNHQTWLFEMSFFCCFVIGVHDVAFTKADPTRKHFN